MGKMIVDGSGNAQGGADADYSDEAMKTIGPASPERLIAALAMYVRDELNLLRADPLTILGARTVDDVVNGIKAKLT